MVLERSILRTKDPYLSIVPFRCLVGMAVHAEDPANDETDKTLWILARFTFLLAELGILALSVCIGRLSDPYSSDPAF